MLLALCPFRLQAAACALTPDVGLNLGPTDYTQRLRPRGELKAVMLFVDFPDAAASETPEQLYNLLVPYAAEWIAEVSNGVASLKVTPVKQWYRMPKPSTEYQWRNLTTPNHKAYVWDAVAASAGAHVAFTRYDLVYILAARGGAIFNSPTLEVAPGNGIPVEGGEIRQVVTLGNDTRGPRAHYGSHVMLHEMGHLFGLPDLYEYGERDFLRSVGGWDTMSWVATGAHFTAWQKAKLGWIEPDQIQCVPNGAVTATLTPVETARGLKALAVPVSPSRAYVVEAREPIKADAGLCDQGLLVYTVDTTIGSGRGAMKVIGGTRGAHDEGTRKCGPAYDATFSLKAGKPSLFEDPGAGVSIELLDASPGAYRVRVTRSAPAPGPALLISRSSVAWTWRAGEPAPAAHSVSVTSTSAALPPALSVATSRSPWLSVAVDSPTAPAKLTIAANPAGLKPGHYTGTVTVTSPGAGFSPRTVAATLTILPAGAK
ncbi:MAG: M6 family metalloprotease domain-containing protein [Acidobacteriia bacterium]|nr:M6 family metalloprotease domain-containing protein [Terriglobia bacterium]